MTYLLTYIVCTNLSKYDLSQFISLPGWYCWHVLQLRDNIAVLYYKCCCCVPSPTRSPMAIIDYTGLLVPTTEAGWAS